MRSNEEVAEDRRSRTNGSGKNLKTKSYFPARKNIFISFYSCSSSDSSGGSSGSSGSSILLSIFE